MGSCPKGRRFESCSRNIKFDKAMGNTNNIEQQTASTILQKPIEVRIGESLYKVAPPSAATLILVSELVSQLPTIRLNSDNVLIESLYVAKDCRILGDIIAVLVLGAKGVQEEREVVTKKLFGLREIKHTEVIDKQAELADKILKELSPRILSKLTIDILGSLEIADFFGLTASLLEVNLLRQTRGAGTIASGR